MANKESANNNLTEYNKIQKKEKIESLKKKYESMLNSKLLEVQKFFKENYEVFDKDAWDRVLNLIKKVQNESWENLIEFDLPKLFIDPEDGAFNCFWENDYFKLLLDISIDEEEPIHIYGKKTKPPLMEHEVRIPPKIAFNSIIDWLKLIYNE